MAARHNKNSSRGRPALPGEGNVLHCKIPVALSEWIDEQAVRYYTTRADIVRRILIEALHDATR